MEVRPPRAVSRLIVLAPGQLHDLLTGSGNGRGRGSKLTLVEVIHLHGLAKNGDGFGSWIPIKISIHQESIIALQGGEVVPIGIAVACGIHLGGIVCIDHPIQGAS